MELDSENIGKVFIGWELSSDGTTTPDTVSITEVGIRNWLTHFKIINKQPWGFKDLGLAQTQMRPMPDDNCYIISENTGIYKVLVETVDYLSLIAAEV